jgi:hypothetical protein
VPWRRIATAVGLVSFVFSIISLSIFMQQDRSSVLQRGVDGATFGGFFATDRSWFDRYNPEASKGDAFQS